MTAHEYGIIDSVDAILHKFGAVGRGNGQFDHPLAASSCTYVNDSGKNETIIAVSDAGNARIQILLQNGLLLRALGDGNGAGPGQLDNPNGLDWGGAEVNEPNLAVADQNNHRIQVWVEGGREHLGKDSCYGSYGALSQSKKQTSVDTESDEPPTTIGADYGGYLSVGLTHMKLNRPGSVCWVESGYGHNCFVVADTYNNRLQFVDLDKGYARILCGRDKILNPTSVVYHNGWRWCSGSQSKPPPLAHESNSKPIWFLEGMKKEMAQIAAKQLLDSFEEEKQHLELLFEERQVESGGMLAQSELEESILELYGNFRVWRVAVDPKAKSGQSSELVIGVLSKDIWHKMQLALKIDKPLKLHEYPVSVRRTPEGYIDKYFFKGRAYSDLYALIANIGLISKTRWNLPQHEGRLAVSETNISRVSILSFYPPRSDNEYLGIPFIRVLGPVNGREMSGFTDRSVLDQPCALSMSPYGDLAIGDKRASDIGGSRIIVYNVLNHSVNYILKEPFLGGEKRQIREPVFEVTEEGGQGSEVFGAAPVLIPAMLSNGALFALEGESCKCVVLRRPNPPAGRCGNLLSLIPSQLMNEFILPHLTYRNAEQARGVCKYLHDWTKKKRDVWLLWPLQPLGLQRIRMLFVDWAKLSDGRSLKSQHPPLVDSKGGALCPRFLEGRCDAGILCNLSHEVPQVDEEVIMRELEEIEFRTDARNDYLGACFQEKKDCAIVTKIVNGGNFDRARIRKGWRVSKVGNMKVKTLREMEEALRYYRDLSSACDWLPGSESEALHSSKRPIKITCQNHVPERPYFTIMDFYGGFYCACTEFLGLPFWWEHEYEIRELFLQKAQLYQMDDRRDTAVIGLHVSGMRQEQRAPLSVAGIKYPDFVELMTLLTEVRFELSSFRIIFNSLFKPKQKKKQSAVEKSCMLPQITNNTQGTQEGTQGGRSSSPLPQITGTYAEVYSGTKLSQPYSIRDGKPVKNRNRLTLDNGSVSVKSAAERGLMMPLTMPPPEPRGLGMNQLETHILQFDYQNQKLDAALSNLF